MSQVTTGTISLIPRKFDLVLIVELRKSDAVTLRYVVAAAAEAAERRRVQKADVPGNSELRHLGGGGGGCGDADGVICKNWKGLHMHRVRKHQSQFGTDASDRKF